MKKVSVLLALVAIAIAAYSMTNWTTQSNQSLKASSNITKDVRSVDNFDKVDVSGAISVEVTYGSEESIEVKAPENYHKFVQTKVKSGTLILKMESGRNYTEGVKIHIKTAKLNGFEISGASSIHLNNSLKDDHLTVHSSGAGNFSGDLAVNEADVTLDGASNVKVTGTTQSATMHLSGASEFVDYDFEAQTLNVNLSGASSMRVTCSKSIDGDVSGASNLSYDGNPNVNGIGVSGAASVNRR